MMMNVNKFKYLILIILLSCGEKSNLNLSSLEDIYITQANRDNSDIVFDSIFTTYRCLEFEKNDKNIIGEIDYFELFNGYLYIVDKKISRSVFIYSDKGQFVNKISNFGRGPGQFVKIECVNFNKKLNRIEVFDSERKVILLYDFMGNFISEIKSPITFEDFVYDDLSDSYYFYCKYFPNKQGNYRVYIADQNFLVTQKRIRFNKSMIGSTMISMSKNFVKSDSTVYFMESYNNSVYTLDLNGMHEKMNIQFYENNVDYNLINSIYDKHEAVSNEGFSYIMRYMIGLKYQFYEFPFNGVIQKYLQYEEKNFVFSNILNISERFGLSRLVYIDEKNNEIYFIYDAARNGNRIISQIDTKGELGSILSNEKDIFNTNPLIIICKLK